MTAARPVGVAGDRAGGVDFPAGTPAGWAALGALLRREDLRVIRGPERRRLLSRWEEIAERERRLDDRLFLGIIGGTGVGKSTIINAIAGASISTSGDRRPTTSRVVAYRHHASPLPADFPRDDLAVPEAVHDQEGMERMVVLDFPDFDSVEADHAAVLGRFLPRLDVLLVLVDDEKYGDLRLFEVLRALPQAPRNLHFVLNKVDRLAARYGDRWPGVAEEILADLRGKLAAHGGLCSGSPWLIAASARAAFDRRAGRGGEGGGGEDEARRIEGDFEAILDLLSGYRAEKRRRAAKEANLEAEKSALARSARSAGLAPATAARAAAAHKALKDLNEELGGTLAGIRSPALGPRDLRRLYSWALRRSGKDLAFPLGWLIGLLRRKDGVPGLQAAEITARARAHYRIHRDGLRVAERELSEAIAGVAGPPAPPPAPPAAPEDPGKRLLSEIDVRLPRALRRGRLRAHLFPVLLILLGLWFALQPAIAGVVESLKKGEPVSWTGVLIDLLWALVRAASPLGILSLLAALAAAYALAALIDWRRIRRAVDGAAAELEEELREEARDESAAVFRRLAAPLARWERERQELAEALVSPQSPVNSRQ